MKHFTRILAAVGMTAALLGCGGALAAEEAVVPEAAVTGEAAVSTPAAEAGAVTVAVELDGENLTFSDAVPQVRDQRTFLPFRAVFEAMGAQVSNEGDIITAVRGGKTLTMTIGSTEATLTEGDVTTPIAMDVAPYVDNATWRTYVPVRFAAQAFGCAVGWDQENSTAIIIDGEKLLDKVAEGKSFTYMEKYLNYVDKYNTGLWDMTLDMDGSMTLMGAPILFTAQADGTVEGSEKMELDMTMTMDMEQFMTFMMEMSGSTEPLTAEDQAMLDALATEGVTMTMRADMVAGLLYMNMKGELLETAGMDPNTWYSMDMAATYEELGMDWEAIMDVAKTMDYEALVKSLFAMVEPTAAGEDYAGILAAAEAVAAFFSDEAFVAEGNVYTNSLALNEAGAELALTFSLTMEEDAVVGYALDFSLSAADAEGGTAVTMDMTASMDDKDNMEAAFAMDMAGMVGMEMNMTGGYTPGTAAPNTQPPEGATVIPYTDLAE